MIIRLFASFAPLRFKVDLNRKDAKHAKIIPLCSLRLYGYSQYSLIESGGQN